MAREQSSQGTDRDDLEDAVGDYGDTLTVKPRLYCEDCERFVYVTSPDESADTHYYLECGCYIVSPDDRPDNWVSVSNLVS